MKFKFLKIILVVAFIISTPIKKIHAWKDICGGASWPESNNQCDCEAVANKMTLFTNVDGDEWMCCGLVIDNKCTPGAGNTDSLHLSDEERGNILNLTSETFDSLNPLKIANSSASDDLSTPGGIASRLLNFLFPLAGLILFALISWGGFEMLIGATDQKGLEAGKNRITAAIIGFILLFSSYWLTQIVETIFKISIL